MSNQPYPDDHSTLRQARSNDNSLRSRPLPNPNDPARSGDRSPNSYRQTFNQSHNISASDGSSPRDGYPGFNPYNSYAESRSPNSAHRMLSEAQSMRSGAGNSMQHGQQPSGAYSANGGVTHPMRDLEDTIRPQYPDEAASIELVRTPFKNLVGTGEYKLHNTLNANQVAMITLGCTFGTGLLVGSGTSLNEGGPLGLLLSYFFVCGICYCMMTSLCEMATHVHNKKGFIGAVSKYVHPAVGFALGWTYLCKFLFVPASHINTAATTMKYIGYSVENGVAYGNQTPVPANAWRIIFIVVVIAINCLSIRAFGHFEFWLSTFKVLILITLIVFGLVVDLGAGPLKVDDPTLAGGLGGFYWRPPNGPFGHPKWKYTNFEGDLQRFLGFWNTQVKTLFALMGIELLGVTVGEISNPRISIPKAVKRTMVMVFTLIYYPLLTSSDLAITRGGLSSPFIIAANRFVVKGLVPSVSAAIVVFALSSATSNFYTGSRILYGLALDNQAPALFKNVTAAGRPVLALVALTFCCFLSYIGNDEAANVFGTILDITTTAGAIAWMCILWAHIRFRKMLAVKGVPLDTLRYRAPLHPIGTWAALIGVILITMFKGIGPYATRGVPGVVFAYLLLIVFFALLIVWKYWHHETFADLTEVDILEGMDEVEEEEKIWRVKRAQAGYEPWYKRISEYI